jgi:hypothetical protein
MAEAGMAGLETDHIDHGAEKRAHYRARAAELGLIPTGGSDCHGDRYSPVRLGTATCPPESFAALAAVAGHSV